MSLPENVTFLTSFAVGLIAGVVLGTLFERDAAMGESETEKEEDGPENT